VIIRIDNTLDQISLHPLPTGSDTYLGFNEDSQWPEVTDEVYCDVTWMMATVARSVHGPT